LRYPLLALPGRLCAPEPRTTALRTPLIFASADLVAILADGAGRLRAAAGEVI
jgi:hypothetical protein